MRFRCLSLLLVLLSASPAFADTLEDPVAVVTGDYYAPRFSPDGQRLLVTGPRYRGLWLVPAAGGETRFLTGDERAGVAAHFLADGRVAFKARRAGKMRALVIGGDGAVRAASLPKPLAFDHGDRIYLRTASGIIKVGAGDRFFSPIVSPDKSRVAFLGLTTGVYVYDIQSATLTHLGPGTAPAWGPDSKTLVFERTEDDGHHIVASELWIWRLGEEASPLTDTDARIERRPVISPDGSRIAFDDDRGTVFIARFEDQP